MSDGQISAWHFATRKPVCVRWQNGRVVAMEKPAEPPSRDLWIAPPLFDVQVNGYGGIDFQQDNLTEADLLSAARQLRRDGCTKFFLTLITDDWQKLTARFRHLKRIRDGLVGQTPSSVTVQQAPPPADPASEGACKTKTGEGACPTTAASELRDAIAGWHIEGPFMSDRPGFHGAHNPAFMLEPTPEKIRELRAIAGDDPLLLTISPERNGAIEAIALAVSLGCKISLGHTNASAEILEKAVRVGATGFTHLANGCPRELDRHDNILWRIFERPDLFASLIPDKIHVSPQLFRLCHRVLPSEKIFYTTDAMAAAGAPPGRYTIGAMELEVGEDQIVRQPGKTNFAGSALKPIDGIFRAAQMLDDDWQDVWTRMSQVPANFVGLKNEIAVGAPADFCLLKLAAENELAELKVFVHGQG